jgi:hypothetical protein
MNSILGHEIKIHPMIVLVILFPWLYFLLKGKMVPGIIALVLQLTGIGWILATVWAMNAYQQDRMQRRNEMLIRDVMNSPMNIYS